MFGNIQMNLLYLWCDTVEDRVRKIQVRPYN